MSTITTNRSYVNLGGEDLINGKPLIITCIDDIDADMAFAINDLDESPTFDTGITDGEIVYNSSGTYYRASGDGSLLNHRLGIANVTDDKVHFSGLFGVSSPSLSEGDKVYLDSSTPGGLTVTPDYIEIGVCVQGSNIFFEPKDNKLFDITSSPTILTGGNLSDGTTAGTLKVSALTALL